MLRLEIDIHGVFGLPGIHDDIEHAGVLVGVVGGGHVWQVGEVEWQVDDEVEVELYAAVVVAVHRLSAARQSVDVLAIAYVSADIIDIGACGAVDEREV